MTGEYKFDNYNEKLDEVVYDNSEDYTMDDQQPLQKTAAANTSVTKTVLLVILIQLGVIIMLLLLLICMTAYNTTLQRQQQASECSNDGMMGENTAGDTQSSTGGVSTTTYNTTEMQKVLQTFTNNVIQLVNSSSSCYSQDTSNVYQTLQEIQNIDDDFHTNISDTLTLLLGDIEAYFTSIISTLSNHRDITITTATVVDDILIGVDKLLEIHNASALYNSITPVSCKDIKAHFPDSPSGYYHVNNRDIYCNMEELCDSSEGWTRIAYLDMTDSTQTCPDGLQYFTYNGVRTCRRQYSSAAGCSPSVKFPTNGISYTQICGRVTGYQLGSPDAVTPVHGPASAHNDLNSFYVDGISLTRGSPRQHVWTFIGGLMESYFWHSNCPCNNPPGSTQELQSFVGDHYFCESGNSYSSWVVSELYTSDPLWDGKGCGSMETDCCSADGLPWFHRQYDNATTDFIEMRLCDDEGTDNEGVPVAFYEIFVN